MANRQDAYEKIEKIQETDMEKAIELEDKIADFRHKIMKKMTYDQKMNEKLVEEKMQPIYNQIVQE